MLQLTVPQSFDLLPRQFGFIDDFLSDYVSADFWTAVLTDSGTAALGDAAGGVLTLTPSDGTVANNDEAYIKSTKECFKIANGKPIEFLARVGWKEGATDDVNIWVGMKDAIAADSLLDDGGGPAASYSGFGFFKVDGGTKWNFESSLGATQTTTALPYTSLDSTTAYHSLKVRVVSRGATIVEVIPYIDTAGGQNFVQCQDNNGLKVKHTITLGSPTEMNIGAGIKNGADTTAEALRIDYLGAYQLR